MGTSWKEQEVSEAFNQYNDMLENILGYEVILDMVRNDKTITKIPVSYTHLTLPTNREV